MGPLSASDTTTTSSSQCNALNPSSASQSHTLTDSPPHSARGTHSVLIILLDVQRRVALQRREQLHLGRRYEQPRRRPRIEKERGEQEGENKHMRRRGSTEENEQDHERTQ